MGKPIRIWRSPVVLLRIEMHDEELHKKNDYVTIFGKIKKSKILQCILHL